MINDTHVHTEIEFSVKEFNKYNNLPSIVPPPTIIVVVEICQKCLFAV